MIEKIAIEKIHPNPYQPESRLYRLKKQKSGMPTPFLRPV